jgi:hypothetical protein
LLPNSESKLCKLQMNKIALRNGFKRIWLFDLA